jgi:hypothetical protein
MTVFSSIIVLLYLALNEDQQIENMLIPTASISLPSKRKLPGKQNTRLIIFMNLII